MSLIYPKRTNLPSRLHCSPVPYVPYSSKNNDNDKDKNEKISWRLSDDDDMFVVCTYT